MYAGDRRWSHIYTEPAPHFSSLDKHVTLRPLINTLAPLLTTYTLSIAISLEQAFKHLCICTAGLHFESLFLTVTITSSQNVFSDKAEKIKSNTINIIMQCPSIPELTLDMGMRWPLAVLHKHAARREACHDFDAKDNSTQSIM